MSCRSPTSGCWCTSASPWRKIDEKEALLTLAAVQKLGTAYTDEMDAFRGTA